MDKQDNTLGGLPFDKNSSKFRCFKPSMSKNGDDNNKTRFIFDLNSVKIIYLRFNIVYFKLRVNVNRVNSFLASKQTITLKTKKWV